MKKAVADLCEVRRTRRSLGADPVNNSLGIRPGAFGDGPRAMQLYGGPAIDESGSALNLYPVNGLEVVSYRLSGNAIPRKR